MLNLKARITEFYRNPRELQDKITLLMNHLLVIYAFLIPISNRGFKKVFAILFILFLIRRNYWFYLKEVFSNKIVQAILIFTLINVIWIIGTNNSVEEMVVIKNLKYYLYIVIFLAFLDKSFSYRVISALILGMLFCELLSYLIHFSILPAKLEIFKALIYETVQSDPTPFIQHSRYNTMISMVIGILLLELLTTKENWFIKSISIFFIITASINLVLVGGRIGYITYIVVLFTTLILTHKKKIIKLSIPVLCAISIFYFLAYNYSTTFKTRIDYSVINAQSLLSNNPDFSSSEGQRVGVWKYSFTVIRDNFIFGVGTADGMDEVRAKIPLNLKYLGELHHAHNEYIINLLQFGIIGLIAFLNIFYQIFRYKIEYNELKSILYITTIAIAVSLLTDEIDTQAILQFWILVIAATSTKNTYLCYKDKLTNKKILTYVLVGILSLAYGFQILSSLSIAGILILAYGFYLFFNSLNSKF